MLSVNNLSKTYGDNLVLRGVSFLVSPGERVGLAGPNGCGKTTLLHIITGTETADAGRVQIAPGVRVGYLSQGLSVSPETTLARCLTSVTGDVRGAEEVVACLADQLTARPSDAALHESYDAALARLQALGAQADPARVAATLKQLGLAEIAPETPVGVLSGGQKTRLGLALVLLSHPQLLLLDEPTNHLDLDMLLWLEGWLQAFPGAAVIVSHDRAFLDASVTRILELDPRTQALRSYAGNYSDYLDQKQAEIEHQRQAYADQQDEIGQLRNAARHLRGLTKMKRGGKADDGDKFATGFFSDQTTRMARRAKQLEHRLEKLLNDDHLDKPRDSWKMKLAFENAPASGRDVLVLESLSVGYGAPLLRDISQIIRHGERVALIGANGSGKTTLAHTIAGQLPPLAGRARLGANVRLGYFAQEHERLEPRLNALTTLQQFSHQTDTELRNFLHYFLFEDDDVFVPVAELSFGERARLMLAVLVAQGCNFLLLDEPINHLDIPSRERFEQALSAFEGTALVIAHDRYFIERFATRVWEVKRGGLHAYADLADALNSD